MFYIPSQNLFYEWLPLLTAQLIAIILLYFALVSRKTLIAFRYHSIFLFCFFLYFFTKPFQLYTEHQVGIYILFIRTFLYTAIAVPALVTALFQQCGIPLNKKQTLLLFSVSIISCLCVVAIQDIANYNYIFTDIVEDALPFSVTNNMALSIVTFQILTLFMLPCFYLLRQQLNDGFDPVNLSFLLGATLLSCFQMIGSHIHQAYWVLYVGAVFMVCCWICAVYFDLQRIRGRAHVVKDELIAILRSGQLKNSIQDVELLWQKLEDSAEKDVLRYKLQVREVLSRLAELSIDQGINKDLIFARNNASNLALENSTDLKEIREIAIREILELSDIVEDSAELRKQKLVQQVKAFISSEFASIKDINQVAKHCGVSRSSLMNHFKQLTGVTINQFLTQTKIEVAKSLLPTMSVTETAFAVGFKDSNYFSTVFKKQTSLSPVQYKEQHSTT